jgi:hypothetical protein
MCVQAAQQLVHQVLWLDSTGNVNRRERTCRVGISSVLVVSLQNFYPLYKSYSINVEYKYLNKH